MYISSFRLTNYKSFYKPTELALRPGFNIITGQNNAGKTALLEGLSLRFTGNPHRSIETVPVPSTEEKDLTSSAVIGFTIGRDELFDLLNRYFSDTDINVPWPVGSRPFAPGYESYWADKVNTIFSEETLTFTYKRNATGDSSSLSLARDPTFGLWDPLIENKQRSFIVCRLNHETRRLSAIGSSAGTDPKITDFGFRVVEYLSQRVYCFRAERFNIGTSRFGTSRLLAPDARNLPEVLAMLQSNREDFREYNELVHRILPAIRWISVQPSEGQNQRIRVWTVDPDSRREDLSFPLEECGSGIGQVLAIMYVVLSSRQSTTIIIDEPQSFLHPGAAWKLIELLKQHERHHQFIIATHSPAIITASNFETITVVRQEGTESTFEAIDRDETEKLRNYLAEIGARLNDVFGADNVFWVEGSTEERCFPKILERIAGRSLMGTRITGMINTGDLTGRNADLIINIYQRLSHANSLLPPAIGFVFDDEGRTDQQKKELRHRSGDKVTFLQRRMYENYLLNPEAIAAVINSIEGSRSTALAVEQVKEWLDSHCSDARYGKPRQGRKAEPWIEYVDAARLLGDLFGELTDTKESYNKVVHSIALTDWLIEHSPEDLRPIADLLTGILDQGLAATAS
jgi:predicted ATPase